MKKSALYMIAFVLFASAAVQGKDEGKSHTVPDFAESDKAYGVYVFMTNSFTITNGGWTKLEYTYEQHDDHGIHSAGDFLFPKVGWWAASINVNIESYDKSLAARLAIRTNGIQMLLLDHAFSVNVRTNFMLRGSTHFHVHDTGVVYSIWVENNDSINRSVEGSPQSAVTRASAIYRGK